MFHAGLGWDRGSHSRRADVGRLSGDARARNEVNAAAERENTPVGNRGVPCRARYTRHVITSIRAFHYTSLKPPPFCDDGCREETRRGCINRFSRRRRFLARCSATVSTIKYGSDARGKLKGKYFSCITVAFFSDARR